MGFGWGKDLESHQRKVCRFTSVSPPKVSPKMCKPCVGDVGWGLLPTHEYMAQRMHRARLAAWQWAYHEYFIGWVGYDPRETQGEAADLTWPMQLPYWPCGRGFNPGKILPFCSLPLRKTGKETMAFVPPAFTLILCNSVFPHISLASLKLLIFFWIPRWVFASESVFGTQILTSIIIIQ